MSFTALSFYFKALQTEIQPCRDVSFFLVFSEPAMKKKKTKMKWHKINCLN